jgi:hypothetical protein
VEWNEGDEVEFGLSRCHSLRHLSSEWPGKVSVAGELEGVDHGVNRRLVGPERDESVVGWWSVATGQAGERGRRVCNPER